MSFQFSCQFYAFIGEAGCICGGLNKDVREAVRSVIEMLQQSYIYLSNVFLETLCRVIIFIIISSIVHNLSLRKSRPYLRNIFAAHRQYNYWPLIRIHPCKKDSLEMVFPLLEKLK